MTFAFFFEPILPRLPRCYWVSDHWPFTFPLSEEAEAALKQIEGGLTPPGVVLPRLADQIVGDRDQFFGFLEPPTSVEEFRQEYHAARRRDNEEWERLLAPITMADAERHRDRVERHIRSNGSHSGRLLDAHHVEFAFLTNDTVWWVAARQPDVIDDLARYASQTKGMTFRETVSFGM